MVTPNPLHNPLIPYSLSIFFIVLVKLIFIISASLVIELCLRTNITSNGLPTHAPMQPLNILS